MNKVILIGNLSKEFELKYLNTGLAVGSVSIATNRTYTKENGQKENEAMFIDLSMFGRTAEICNQYLKKGSKICVEGRLVFQQWNDTQGNKRSKHIIAVEKVEFLDSKNNDNVVADENVDNANTQVVKAQVEANINLSDVENALDSIIQKNFNIHVENDKAIIHFKGTQIEYDNAKAKWEALFNKIKSSINAKSFDVTKEIIKDNQDEIPF